MIASCDLVAQLHFTHTMKTHETLLQTGNEVTLGSLEQWKVEDLSVPLTARQVLHHQISLADPRLAHLEHDPEERAIFERNRLMLTPAYNATRTRETGLTTAVEQLTGKQIAYLTLHQSADTTDANASAGIEDVALNREILRLMGPGITMLELFAIQPDGTVDPRRTQRVSAALLDSINPLGDVREFDVIRNPSPDNRVAGPSGYSSQDVGLFGQMAIEMRRMAIGTPHGDGPVGMAVLPHLAHGTIVTDRTAEHALRRKHGNHVTSLHLLHADDSYITPLGNSYFDASYTRMTIDLNNGTIAMARPDSTQQVLTGFGMRLLLRPETVDRVALADGRLEPVPPSVLMGVDMKSATLTHAAIRELTLQSRTVSQDTLSDVQDRTNERITNAFASGFLTE